MENLPTKSKKRKRPSPGEISAEVYGGMAAVTSRRGANGDDALSPDDGAYLLGALDAISNRYRSDIEVSPESIDSIFLLMKHVQACPGAYLPILQAGLEQARYAAKRKAGGSP